MPAAERRALVVCDDDERAQRHVSVLRRVNLRVLKANDAAQAEVALRRGPIDLIVFVQPFPGADRLAASARAEGSPTRRAGIVLVSDAAGDAADSVIASFANRRLERGGELSDFERTVAELLAVAPRIDASPDSRLSVILRSGSRLRAELVDFSVSGMLLRVPGQLPIGSQFGFVLRLPGEEDPIRGRARVVRSASPPSLRGQLVAARFLALGGEAPERLGRLVERAHSAEAAVADGAGGPATGERIDTPPGAVATLAALRLDRDDVERCRAELAELSPVLDRLLERGLSRRLQVAEWYVTGAELGLESLRAFSEILASVYESRAISPEARRRLADLVEVRGQLAEFGLPAQDVETRVRILLALRPALERLLRELAETGAAAGTGLEGYQAPGVVSLAVTDIQRLVGLRRTLGRVGTLLDGLGKPRLPFSGRGVRRSARQIAEAYGAVGAALGVPLDADRLRRRGGIRDAARAIQAEERGAARRLAAVHRKAFSLAFRSLATDDVEADLVDPKLHQVLVDILAAGGAYLARAYGAYRHALEVIHVDPAVIDRVESLGATLSAAAQAEALLVAAPRPPALADRGA